MQVPQQTAVGAADVHHLRVPVREMVRQRLGHGGQPRVVPRLLAAAGGRALVFVLGQPRVVGVVVRLGHAGIGVDEAAAVARHHVVAVAERVAVGQDERLVVEDLRRPAEADGARARGGLGQGGGAHARAAHCKVRRTPSSKPIHSSSPSSDRARAVPGT